MTYKNPALYIYENSAWRQLGSGFSINNPEVFSTLGLAENVAVNSGMFPSGTFTPADNLQSRISVELGRFRTWAGGSHSLYLGEFGIPNNKGGDQASWNALLPIIYKRAQADNFSLLSYWATGHRWGTGYNLSPYNTSTTPGTSWSGTAIESVVDEVFDYNYSHGINYAGMEFGTDDATAANAPAESDFEYHANKGYSVFRYPLGEPIWTSQWLWDPATSSLRSGDLSHVELVLNRAQATGVQIVLDVLHPGGGAKYATIDGNTLATTAGYDEYIDYITALLNHTFNDNNAVSTSLKNHPAIYAIDICNEPANVTWQQWETISQGIIDYIRDSVGLNWNGLVMVPLGGYSGVQDLTFRHTGGPWITDSANNFMYEGHYYPEVSHVGNFDTTYASDVSASGSFSGQGSFTY